MNVREKLQQFGVKGLSDFELLYLLSDEKILRSMLPIPISWSQIYRWTKEDWLQLNGLTEKEIARLQCALEIGLRLRKEKSQSKESITHPDQLRELLISELGYSKQEHLFLLCFNIKNQIIAQRHIFVGGFDESIAQPREIFYYAIQHQAKKIMIAHNHPSGMLTPSESDLYITKKIQTCGELLGIELLDHFIVSSTDVLSLRKEGEME